MDPALPSPRGHDTYRIGVVCLGNICRSPTAEVVLTRRLAEAGLDDRVEVESCGTGPWHLGEPMDRRAARQLVAAGYDPSEHHAQRITPDWFTEYDLLLAMDSANRAELEDLAPDDEARGRIRMFRDFDPVATATDRDVPDPWFGADDGFAEVLRIVERTSDALVARLVRWCEEALST